MVAINVPLEHLMADGSTIEWLDRPGTKPASWNPIRAGNPKTGTIGWHCEHVHEGCRNCYAERLNTSRFGTGLDYARQNRDKLNIVLNEKTLLQPLHWRVPRTVFVCSMTDLYGSWVKDEWLDRIYAVMALCPQHTFIVLTKRPERMREYLSWTWQFGDRGDIVEIETQHIGSPLGVTVGPDFAWPLPNVWAGTSCSTQEDADKFIPEVLATPLAKRIVSLEPLLGAIDLTRIAAPDDAQDGWIFNALAAGDYYEQRIERVMDTPVYDSGDGPYREHRLDWVIVGGESGTNARPMHPDWARSLRDQCKAAGVPFFFKQWGEFAPHLARGGVFRAPDFGALKCADANGKRYHAYPKQMEPLEHDEGFVCTFDIMERVGKKAAGRLLDGREWNEFPVPSVTDDPVKVRSPIVTQNNESSTK